MKEKFKEWCEDWDIIGILKISAFVITLVIILTMVFVFILSIGNTKNQSDTKDIFETDRFVHELDKESLEYISYVITDKISGVQYLLIDDADGAAIIKLEGGKK